MSDRIDPGPGWRLLEVGERKPDGYEYRSRYWANWVSGVDVGGVARKDTLYRARISEPRTIKGIATRATVRSAHDGGTVVSNSICNPDGLSAAEMSDIARMFDASMNIANPPKYIMLEIQRGKNDF